MLFLVLSSPHPSRPSEAAPARREFREWLAELWSDGVLVSAYPRVGRGMAIILDVPSNDDLHALLTRWSEIVPASFDIHPLATPETAERLLA